uniref:DNA helicase Pif1-like 2B domain-containing protein n=1 Tax=Cajanus cajan TaxID=3821 RepID=A0A151R5R1_CAJCA|nr:hypothetical protein KK1_040825 [Cajanus cajan]
MKVKKGVSLMLLRNINPKAGLCNGTRLLCRGLFTNILDVEILTGHNAGKRAFLPKIKHKTTEFQASTKILIKEGKLEGEDENFTKNVVFKEILLSKN